MTYEIEIVGLKRHLTLCPIHESLYIGAFVMFGDVEITIACARALLDRAPEYDVIITAESKGIPLAYEMARQNGSQRYLVARKGGKFYMRNLLCASVNSITTAGIQTLCIDGDDAEYMRGRRVLIVDDVISTGDSLKAVEALVEKAGAKVVGRMAVLAEGNAQLRKDIIYLAPLPLFRPDGTPIIPKL